MMLTLGRLTLVDALLPVELTTAECVASDIDCTPTRRVNALVCNGHEKCTPQDSEKYCMVIVPGQSDYGEDNDSIAS